MAPNVVSTMALLVTLNLLFFTMVSSTYTPCSPPPHKKSPPHNKSPSPPKKTSPPSHSPPKKSPPSSPSSPTPSTPSASSCPVDTLKLGVCADLLGGLVGLVVGTPANSPCCSLLQGLADLDAAVCLCTAIKANVLGINLNVPVSLSLLLNNCGKNLPSDFQCA